MSWEAALDYSLGNTRNEGSVHSVHFVQGVANNKKAPQKSSSQSLVGRRSTETRIFTPMDFMDNMDKIPPLTAEESREIDDWPAHTRRVLTRLLEHFKAQGFPLPQAERLSLATLMVLKKRKGWPLILVSDLPPEIGRAIGYVLDAFPGTKLMNYSHDTGTVQ